MFKVIQCILVTRGYTSTVLSGTGWRSPFFSLPARIHGDVDGTTCLSYQRPAIPLPISGRVLVDGRLKSRNPQTYSYTFRIATAIGWAL